MIPLGGKKRIFSGIWILAALLLIGYNGLTLSTLFSPPLVGHSQSARLASQKWLRLESKMAEQARRSVDQVDVTPIMSRFTPEWPTARAAGPSPEPAPSPGTVTLQPPVLTGVMEVSDARGGRRLSALMEGRRWVENERIRGFLIRKITLKGVTLTHSGQQWFIPAPTVHFMQGQRG